MNPFIPASPFTSHRFFSILGIFAVTFLTGCGSPNPDSPQFVVAQGKGFKITKAELDQALDEFFTQRRIDKSQLPADHLQRLQKQVLEQLASEVLLKNLGAKTDPPDMEAQVHAKIKLIEDRFGGRPQFEARLQQEGISLDKMKADISKQIRIEAVINTHVPKPPPPTEEALKKFYDEHLVHFQQPEMVRASHILVKVDEKATDKEKTAKKKFIEGARTRVVKGEDFAKVAREVSEDPGSAQNGGDLNFFGRGQMVPEFDKIAFESKIGTLSPVFKTQFGYHFLKVTDRKSASTHSLDEVRPRITEFLTQRERGEKVQQFIKKLQEDAKITYHLPDVPPPLPKISLPPGATNLPPIPPPTPSATGKTHS